MLFSGRRGSTLKFAGAKWAALVESRESRRGLPEDRSRRPWCRPATEGEILKLLASTEAHFTQPPPASPRPPRWSKNPRRARALAGAPPTPRSSPPYRTRVRGGGRRARSSRRELGNARHRQAGAFFPDDHDVDFTAQLEESLDKVEEGDGTWMLSAKVQQARSTRTSASEDRDDGQQDRGDTGEKCPGIAASRSLEKWARLRQVPGVLGYPDCQYTKAPGRGREKPAE